MSSTSRVTASAAAPLASVAGRVGGSAGRAMSDRVDAPFGSSYASLNDPWRRSFGDSGQGGFGGFGQSAQDWNNDRSAESFYTPVVLLAAAAFPASETNPDSKFSRPVFIADLQRGVGTYEFNMKICSGAFASQGTLVNRYS